MVIWFWVAGGGALALALTLVCYFAGLLLGLCGAGGVLIQVGVVVCGVVLIAGVQAPGNCNH